MARMFKSAKKGGHLITGIANPIVFAFTISKDKTLMLSNPLPYNPLSKGIENYDAEKNGGIQFSHSWTTQLGEQIKAGLKIIDLYEDYHFENSSVSDVGVMLPAQIASLLTKYTPIYLVTLAQKE